MRHVAVEVAEVVEVEVEVVEVVGCFGRKAVAKAGAFVVWRKEIIEEKRWLID